MAERVYIDAELAKDAICECYITDDEKLMLIRRINRVPAADVVPVRHGTWIKADEQPYFRKHYHAKVCSECGKRKDGKWLYCPHCGSKNQDGGQDDGT